MGIIFEEDARQKRAVISGFMEGSPAAQLAQVISSVFESAIASLT